MMTAKWSVDTVHSNVDFTVRHMMVSKVIGSFTDFDAKIEADVNDLTSASITFTIQVASVDTKNESRDNHLRSGDFFDADNHPTLTFQAKEITRKKGDIYEMTGDVTLRGVTNEETFTVEFEGVAKDPMSGAEKAGFSVDGKIKRSEYGLNWNAALETGGVLVSDDVNIHLDLQLAKAE